MSSKKVNKLDPRMIEGFGEPNGVARLNEEGKVVDAEGNEVKGSGGSLVRYQYTIYSTSDNQTSFEIPMETFSKDTDTEIIIQNTTVLDPNEDYNITNKTVNLTNSVSNGTRFTVFVYKNIPVEVDEKTIHASIIEDGSISIDKLDENIKNLINSKANDLEVVKSVNGITPDTSGNVEVKLFSSEVKVDNKTVFINDDGELTTIKPEKIYGVKIDTTNSNPDTAVNYTDNAVGFTPAKMNFSTDTFDYGSWQNIYPFNQIRPVLFKDGQVVAQLDKNDYSKDINGNSVDITSGNAGDVMIEFPKIYWKFETIGNDLYVKYATKQVDSTWRTAHVRGNDEVDYIYISAYMGYELSGKLRSLSGKTPTADKTIDTFRISAQSNGSGYEQMTYLPLLMLQVLYVIMFKNLDSQTALGRGFVDGDASTTTGQLNTKGLFYGDSTGKKQMKFCGIEDFYGNVYYWIDGVVTDSNYNILINLKNENFDDSGSGYASYSSGMSDNTSGYIDQVQGGTETGFIIKSKNGSNATYYCDYGSLHASRVACFGGSWLNRSSVGAFQLALDVSTSYTYSYLSARLLHL